MKSNEAMFEVVVAAREAVNDLTVDRPRATWPRSLRHLANALEDFDDTLPSADDVRGILGRAAEEERGT